MTVIENVLIGGVETGFHTVLHHLAGPGGTLQFLDLNTNVTQHLVQNTPKYLSDPNAVFAGFSTVNSQLSSVSVSYFKFKSSYGS